MKNFLKTLSVLFWFFISNCGVFYLVENTLKNDIEIIVPIISTIITIVLLSVGIYIGRTK